MRPLGVASGWSRVHTEAAQPAADLGLPSARSSSPRCPERIEARRQHACLDQSFGQAVVDVTQPVIGVPSLGEGFGSSQPFGQASEDGEVVPSLAGRSDDPVHGHDAGVVARRTDVVALERDGGRQHDVRMPSRRGPVGLVHDDRLGLGRNASSQPAEVLVVVEGVAPGPVDQPDIGDRPAPDRRSRTVHPGCSSMSATRATGMKTVDRVAALREGRDASLRPEPGRCWRRCPGRRRSRHRAVPIPPSMAATATAIHTGCSPCSARCRPWAMRDERRTRSPCDVPSDTIRCGRDAADCRGPGRVLGLAVIEPQQVALEARVADAPALEEGRVM